LYLLLFILGILILVTRLGVGHWAWVLGILTLSAPTEQKIRELARAQSVRGFKLAESDCQQFLRSIAGVSYQCVSAAQLGLPAVLHHSLILSLGNHRVP